MNTDALRAETERLRALEQEYSLDPPLMDHIRALDAKVREQAELIELHQGDAGLADMQIAGLKARIAELEALLAAALHECNLAALFVANSPCDPDVTERQRTAWAAYEPLYKARLALPPDAAREKKV